MTRYLEPITNDWHLNSESKYWAYFNQDNNEHSRGWGDRTELMTS